MDNGLEGKVTISASAGIAAFALYSDTKSGGSYYAGINAVKSRMAYGVDPGSVDSRNIVSGRWSGTGLSFTVSEDKRIKGLEYTYQGESDCYNYKFTIEDILTISNAASLHSKNGFIFDAVFSDKHSMSANVTVSSTSSGLMINKVIFGEKDSGDILTSFNLDHPGGLAFDGEFLWCADSANDKIYELDASGNVITSFPSPRSNPHGLAFDGEFLWCAYYSDGNDKIFKLDTTGKVITSFPFPGYYPTGLAFDGEFLWCADSGFSYDTEKIYKLDTTGKVITSFPSPGNGPAGLAFDRGFLWHTDYSDDKIYKLDTTGKVITSFPSPGPGPYGLAFDGEFLWCTDFTDDKIYKIYIRY